MELTAGYKLTEIGAIPSDWDVQCLASLGSFKNGINKNKEDFGYGSPFVNLLDVFGVPRLSQSVEKLSLVNTTELEQDLYDLRKGDVLFVRSSVKPEGVGLTTLIQNNLPKTVFSGFLIRFRDHGILENSFKQYCFFENGFRNRLVSSSTVSANTNINQDALKNLQIAFPVSLEEQRAIAQALSDVDALIAGLERLITKKRDMKQAAMQQLLTGQTRLPGFSGEWKLELLEKLIDSLEAGVSVNSTDEQVSGEVACVLKTSALSGGLFKPNEAKVIEPRDIGRARVNPKSDTILISRMNTPLLVGEIAYISRDFDKLFLPDRIWMAQFNKTNSVCVRWLAYLLSSKVFQTLLRDIATGTSGSMKNISKSALLSLPVRLPTMEEQTAIAEVLSDMDAELSALTDRLAKTRQIKQGMMQELLTGKTRLI